MTHSSSHLLGFGVGFRGGVHRRSAGSSSFKDLGSTNIGDCLVCIIGVLVDCVLLVLSSVLTLVNMSESLPIHVSVFESALECFLVLFNITLGMFQFVALTGVSGTISFCINVQSACNMSHFESMIYLR